MSIRSLKIGDVARGFLVLTAGIVAITLAAAVRWLDQPWTLDAYIRTLISRGDLVPIASYQIKWERDLEKDRSLVASLKVNSNNLNVRDLSQRLYFVDAVKVINDPALPWAWRTYTRQYLFHNGVAFPCMRVAMVDASPLRDPRPRLRIDPVNYAVINWGDFYDMLPRGPHPIPITDTLSFVTLHELAHLNEPPNVFFAGQQVMGAYKRGTAELSQQQFDQARTDLSSAVSLCPAFVEAIDHLAIAERRLGNGREAEALYKRSLALYPENKVAQQNLVLTMVDQDELDPAAARAVEFMRADPEDPEYPFWLGVISLKRRQIDKARDYLLLAHSLYIRNKDQRALEVDMLMGQTAQSASVRVVLMKGMLLSDCRSLSASAESRDKCEAVVLNIVQKSAENTN